MTNTFFFFFTPCLEEAGRHPRIEKGTVNVTREISYSAIEGELTPDDFEFLLNDGDSSSSNGAISAVATAAAAGLASLAVTAMLA